eukprot:g43359.t1
MPLLLEPCCYSMALSCLPLMLLPPWANLSNAVTAGAQTGLRLDAGPMAPKQLMPGSGLHCCCCHLPGTGIPAKEPAAGDTLGMGTAPTNANAPGMGTAPTDANAPGMGTAPTDANALGMGTTPGNADTLGMGTASANADILGMGLLPQMLTFWEWD